uniref:SJCHGC03717 protein n=1 Tax=Schistosoma japonicum TaxID=6182 RepID=Q5BSN5_SCHJA|nr:SJCHGC03717 protein [Schistosoma japonicum]
MNKYDAIFQTECNLVTVTEDEIYKRYCHSVLRPLLVCVHDNYGKRSSIPSICISSCVYK